MAAELGCLSLLCVAPFLIHISLAVAARLIEGNSCALVLTGTGETATPDVAYTRVATGIFIKNALVPPVRLKEVFNPLHAKERQSSLPELPPQDRPWSAELFPMPNRQH